MQHKPQPPINDGDKKVSQPTSTDQSNQASFFGSSNTFSKNGIQPPSLFSLIASVLIVSVVFSNVEGLSFFEECGWIFSCLYLCDTVERLIHKDIERAQVNAVFMLIFAVATFVIFHVL